MINISFIGMDYYMVGDIDKRIHSKLSKAFGVNDDEIFVSGFDSYVYHQGNEQTSFNLLVKVECAKKYKEVEKEVANVILENTRDFSIHCTVYFMYFESESSVYTRVNSLYPRFLQDQMYQGEEDYSEEEYMEMDTKTPEGDEIYTGNIFAEFDEAHPEDRNGSFEEERDDDTSSGYNIFDNYRRH